ncbi:hypothetical protein GWI33_007219 [Rhynchophorus ferrugineus]|uniref:Uncharacterized protein n=1 Tax=Rhynchophorus ferrugineus TaxID=354439 RepID=A0A834IGJ1_RHYFE|nr:hypothetical protein GWI33_007219 [Rhynchophorus ferrugineus]
MYFSRSTFELIYIPPVLFCQVPFIHSDHRQEKKIDILKKEQGVRSRLCGWRVISVTMARESRDPVAWEFGQGRVVPLGRWHVKLPFRRPPVWVYEGDD